MAPKKRAPKKRPAKRAAKQRPVPKRRAVKLAAPRPVVPRGVLNARQRAFIREYLVDVNGTQAAIRAGYSSNGADAQAIRLLGNARIAASVARAMRRREEKLELTADRVLNEVARLAFSDLRNYADWGPEGITLVDASELTDAQAAAVAEVAHTATGVRFKLHDKGAALDRLMGHMGLLKQRIELTGKDGVPLMPLEAVRAILAADDAHG